MAVKRGDIDSFPSFPAPSTQGRERMKLKMIDFDAEIMRLNNEALGCTNRMVADLEKINEEGIMTLAALENQDEQLDKLESNLHQINEDISAVKNDIKKMERCCCYNLFCLPFKRFRKHKDEMNKEAAMTSSIIFKHRSMSVPMKDGPFIPRLTNDAIENEIEDNLRQVDETLNSIKHLAVDINIQLSIQEPKLDRIQELIENSDLAMGGAKERVKKLLAE